MRQKGALHGAGTFVHAVGTLVHWLQEEAMCRRVRFNG